MSWVAIVTRVPLLLRRSGRHARHLRVSIEQPCNKVSSSSAPSSRMHILREPVRRQIVPDTLLFCTLVDHCACRRELIAEAEVI